MDEKTETYTGRGRMAIRVSAARGAIPLANARIQIRNGDTEGENRGAILRILYTDASGNTEQVELAAPPRSLSLSPDAGGGRPYATYEIDVYLRGYREAAFSGVPIFDGITSVQSVELVPLPEGDLRLNPELRSPKQTVSENEVI